MLRHDLKPLERFGFVDALALDDDPYRFADEGSGAQGGLETVDLLFESEELIALDLVMVLGNQWVSVGWLH